MSNIYTNIFSVVLIFLMGSLSFAQNPVPNAGFENWTDGEPDDWYSYDYLGLFNSISQSGLSHSGSYAVKGEVVMYDNEVIPPYLASASNFTISENFSRLTGYYQFINMGEDALWVFVELLDDQSMYVASGLAEFGETSGGYTQFAVNLDYTFGSGQLATQAFLWFIIDYSQEAQIDTVTVGSYFLLDDLAFDNVTSITDNGLNESPRTFRLVQNYPNPFNPSTTINFSIPHSGKVNLSIFNSIGQEIDTIIDREMEAGDHQITFYGDNLPSGVYFYKLEVENFTDIKKMILIK